LVSSGIMRSQPATHKISDKHKLAEARQNT
jgi:hypothetical protein